MTDVSRRRAIRLTGSALIAALGGCTSSSSNSPSTTTQTETTTASPATVTTETTTKQPTTTQDTTTSHPNTIFVDASAPRDSGTGTADDPLGSIQAGLATAQPGETVFVRSGEYTLQKTLSTVRSGEPDSPITLTGPPDAVVRPSTEMTMVHIKHSHVQLTGLTFDGLIDPSRPQQLASYGGIVLIRCAPPRTSDEYLTDVAIRPSSLGHSIRPLIVVNRSENLDIGEFEVIGLAGAGYVLTGSSESHAGEIVYLGTPPSSYGTKHHPWLPLDETNNVRIHHIDNSAGHPHSELVNAKMGTHDVVIEYCTDGGGSQNNDPYPSASAHLQSYNATLRWCKFTGGKGYGIHVNAGAKGYLDKIENPPVSTDRIGDDHRIIGNVVKGYDDGPIQYSKTSANAQETVCGNSVSGPVSGSPTESCGENVPDGDGVGHRGGDSPWS